MAPLNIEVYNPNGEWVSIGRIRFGDNKGSMSHNKPNGDREIYTFECANDDSKSVIYRSILGIDAEVGSSRVVNSLGEEIVRELIKGDSYELAVKTDRTPELTRVRFTHI